MLLKNKVIAVTGGSSGIGEAIVYKLLEEQCQVALIDVDQEKGNAIEETNSNIKFYPGDVTDPEGIERVYKQIAADHGQLNGCVNNAGIGGDMEKVADYTVESWRQVMSINLDGVFYCIRAQIPLILASGGGPIVNIASILGIVGQGDIAGYVASKHGVIGLTKSVAKDYGADGIRCNAVCPSYIKTPLTETNIDQETWEQIGAMHSIGKCVTKEDVAAMTAFLLSDESRSMTGSAYMVDGGYTSL